MKLIVIPTPIGNLEDITLRAIRMLKEASVVYAEDTRTSGNLMKHLNIDTKLLPFHKFNEHKIVDGIVNKIAQGQMVALVSDAGTPGISDPGFLLVRACLSHNIEVECLPGATAFVPALVASGAPSDRFVFEGFLPQKKGRQTRLLALENETRTMVFYESPHRILKALQEFKMVFGAERQACVCPEISKKFEEYMRGNIEELIQDCTLKAPKGEIVVVVWGKNAKTFTTDEE